MSGDDLELLLLFVSLGVVLALSAFFWFGKKLREGWLLRTLYIARLFYAAFFAYGVVWIFQVLHEQAPLNQILLVSLPFSIFFLVLSVPWGLITTRLSKGRSHKNPGQLENA